MLVVRGRGDTIERDRAVSDELLAHTGTTTEPVLRVWTPHRQLAFGRRDVRESGYDTACSIASEHGFRPVERNVGGRAVAYTGSTLAFALAVPISSMRTGLQQRYERATATVCSALESIGARVKPGEPTASFCPGAHSVRGESTGSGLDSDVSRVNDREPSRTKEPTTPATGKLCGIAQRVQQDAALVAGCVIVDDHERLAAVLESVYEALDLPFDPDSVGSVAAAGGSADLERVRTALESGFLASALCDQDRFEPADGESAASGIAPSVDDSGIAPSVDDSGIGSSVGAPDESDTSDADPRFEKHSASGRRVTTVTVGDVLAAREE